MNNQNGNTRLVEYFSIIGLPAFCPGPEEEIIQKEQRIVPPTPYSATKAGFKTLPPTLIDRYPSTDYEDSSFPKGVTMFCFPSGIQLESCMVMPKFFQFVLTGDTGEHMYGFAFVFYEPITEYQIQQAIDKGMLDSDTPHLDTYHVPKCLCLLSYWPFVSNFRTFLVQLYRISLSPVSIPIERYITNFMKEIPLPPLTLLVQHHIGDRELIFARPPPNNPISWVDLPFQQVFECLDLENIIKVMTCILCERPVLFQSSQMSLLSGATEVFLAFMYPFVWSHVYIPVLPESLLMVLEAPLPYIIGVESAILQRAYKNDLTVPDTTVHVDLDLNFVSTSQRFPIPLLPQHNHRKLLSRLEKCAPAFRQRSPMWHEEVLPTVDMAINQAARPYELLNNESIEQSRKVAIEGGAPDEEAWSLLPNGECNWVMARAAFFRLYVSMLRDFREYIVYPDTEAKANQNAMHFAKFDDISFLGKKKPKEREFFEALLKSQHFFCFIEDRLHPDVAKDADVLFFEQSIDAKANRSFLGKFIPNLKHNTPFLDKAFKFSKTVVARAADPMPQVEGNALNDLTEVYERFPRLDYGLLELLSFEPMIIDDSAVEEKYKFGKHKRKFSTRLTYQPAQANGRPEDVILDAWFVLYCSSVGKSTPLFVDDELIEFPIYLESKHVQQGDQSVPSSPATIISDDPVDAYQDTIDDTALHHEDTHHVSHSFHHTPRSTSDGHLSLESNEFPNTVKELRHSSLHVKQVTPQTPSFSRSRSISEMVKAPPLNIEKLREQWKLEKNFKMVHIAVEVIRSALSQEHVVDELVFHSLISACGRCGDLDHAILTMGLLYSAGMVPDSRMYSNLVQAFSLNASTSTQIDILNWESFQHQVSAANARLNQQSNITNSSTLAIERLNLFQWEKYNFRSGKTDVKESSTSPKGLFKHSTMNLQQIKDSTATPIQAFQKLLFRHRSRPKTDIPTGKEVDSATTDSASQDIDSREDRFDSITSYSESIGLHLDVGDETFHEGQHLFITGPASPTKSMFDPELRQLYSGLVVDVDREVCPHCSQPISNAIIRCGWKTDPNDYTTKCSNCNRRFVAFFTVFSENSDWKGSTGLRTPLFCEYLSPWVLLTEVQTMVHHHGIEFICCKEFRNKKPTLFWNMMLYFNEFRLPINFLTGHSHQKPIYVSSEVHTQLVASPRFSKMQPKIPFVIKTNDRKLSLGSVLTMISSDHLLRDVEEDFDTVSEESSEEEEEEYKVDSPIKSVKQKVSFVGTIMESSKLSDVNTKEEETISERHDFPKLTLNTSRSQSQSQEDMIWPQTCNWESTQIHEAKQISNKGYATTSDFRSALDRRNERRKSKRSSSFDESSVRYNTRNEFKVAQLDSKLEEQNGKPTRKNRFFSNSLKRKWTINRSKNI